MREPRVEPKLGHSLPVRGDGPVFAQRSKLADQLPRLSQSPGGRGVQPAQLLRVGAPHGELERQRSEVRLEHLRQALRCQPPVVLFRPQTVAHSRPLTARTPPALVGGRPRHRYGLEPRHSRARREPGNAHQPAVHDNAHSLDRQTGLGNGRRQHDLALSRRTRGDRPVLLLRRQPSV
ncbi:Uncharacterised protein [Chlamydia abortus]|nr:Uncharacterised protein [Chlamydia abortus]